MLAGLVVLSHVVVKVLELPMEAPANPQLNPMVDLFKQEP